MLFIEQLRKFLLGDVDTTIGYTNAYNFYKEQIHENNVFLALIIIMGTYSLFFIILTIIRGNRSSGYDTATSYLCGFALIFTVYIMQRTEDIELESNKLKFMGQKYKTNNIKNSLHEIYNFLKPKNSSDEKKLNRIENNLSHFNNHNVEDLSQNIESNAHVDAINESANKKIETSESDSQFSEHNNDEIIKKSSLIGISSKSNATLNLFENNHSSGNTVSDDTKKTENALNNKKEEANHDKRTHDTGNKIKSDKYANNKLPLLESENKTNNDNNSRIEDVKKEIFNEEEPYMNTNHFKYLEQIKLLMKEKNSVESKYNEFYNGFKSLKSEVFNLLTPFDSKFNDFLNHSSKIGNELLNLDISPDLYEYNMKELKTELKKRFSLIIHKETANESQIDENSKKSYSSLETKEDDSSTEKNKGGANHGLKSGYLRNIVKNSFRLLKNRFKTGSNFKVSKENEDLKDEKEKKLNNRGNISSESEMIDSLVKKLFFLLTFQGIFVFFCLIANLFGLGTLRYIFKIFLILISCLCLFFSVHIMVLAHIFHQKCISNKIDACKMGEQRVASDILIQLNEEVYHNGNVTIDDLQERFDDIANSYKIKERDLEENLINLAKNKANEKIEVFNNMFRQLLYIKDDFEKIMNKKIDKDVFYENVNNMNVLIEQIKFKNNTINVDMMVDLLKKFSSLKNEFLTKRDNMNDDFKEFEKEDMRVEKQYEMLKCEKAHLIICNVKEMLDFMYFIIGIISMISIILISLC